MQRQAANDLIATSTVGSPRPVASPDGYNLNWVKNVLHLEALYWDALK